MDKNKSKMNFKKIQMKKDFNVFKIVLALLLVLGSQESVQGQFGMGGFGGYGYNPYSGMGRMRSSVPRTNVAAEPDAPLTAEEITELEMVKVKEALAIDPFEEAILRSILLEFTKKRIELQILKVDPKTLTESFRKLNDLENERLKTELSFATYEKLIELLQFCLSSDYVDKTLVYLLFHLSHRVTYQFIPSMVKDFLKFSLFAF